MSNNSTLHLAATQNYLQKNAAFYGVLSETERFFDRTYPKVTRWLNANCAATSGKATLNAIN